jgi:hypothetical protein
MSNAMVSVPRVTGTAAADEAKASRIGAWLGNLAFVLPDGSIITLAAFAGARG